MKRERSVQIRVGEGEGLRDLDSDPQAVRLLALQYAHKVLEQMGVEPNPRNVAAFLRQSPLKESCTFEESGMTQFQSGQQNLRITRNAVDSRRPLPSPESNCIFKEIELSLGINYDRFSTMLKPFAPIKRRIAQRQERSQHQKHCEKSPEKKVGTLKLIKSLAAEKLIHSQARLKEEESTRIEHESQLNKSLAENDASKSILEQSRTVAKEEEYQLRTEFTIDSLKRKYLFPFNETFQNRANLLTVEQDGRPLYISKGLFFLSKIFQFPFTQVKLNSDSLRALQKPLLIDSRHLNALLHEFCTRFPRKAIPQRAQQRKVYFRSEEVDQAFELIRHEQSSKLAGLLCHLAYWVVFGNVNPVDVPLQLKQELYMQSNQAMEQLCSLFSRKRPLWEGLVLPLLLLALKVVVEEVLVSRYQYFFEQLSYSPHSPGKIALCKVFHLIQSIFDPNLLSSRMVFLEASLPDLRSGLAPLQQASFNSVHDRKYLRKRIYATSPLLNVLLPEPKDGRTRALLARRQVVEQATGAAREQLPPLAEGKQLRKRMFNVLLKKMHNRISSKIGKNNILELS